MEITQEQLQEMLNGAAEDAVKSASNRLPRLMAAASRSQRRWRSAVRIGGRVFPGREKCGTVSLAA
jgi:hypothetical protein